MSLEVPVLYLFVTRLTCFCVIMPLEMDLLRAAGVLILNLQVY